MAQQNNSAAAVNARDVYERLRAHGWDETLAKFKSSTVHRPSAIGTVGDFVSAIRETSTDNPKTLSDYIRSFRLIVSQAFDIEDNKNSGTTIVPGT